MSAPFFKLKSTYNKVNFWLMLVVAGTLMLALPMASASDPLIPGPGYRDFSYPSGTGDNSEVTGEKPESKLWWCDNFWWGILWSTPDNAYHIHRLNQSTQDWVDTGTEVDNRQDTRADALWDGQHLYVVSHIFAKNDGSPAPVGDRGELYRYSYNTGTKTYSLDAGFPVEVTQGKSETLVLAKDSTGQLWVTYVENQQVMINRSIGGSDSAWGTPFALPVGSSANVSSDDISTIVDFEGRIGVMWSNQSGSNTMYFAIHNDNDSDTVWSNAVIAYGISGDDHINLKSIEGDGAGKVFAAIKTSQSSALIVLLVCDAGDCSSAGNWTSYTVSDGSFGPTRPILLLDPSNRDLYVFMRNIDNGFAIYYKTADMDNIQFTPGTIGTPFIQSATETGINDPSSTKQNLNGTTGLVVLASDSGPNFYFHNVLALNGADIPDITVRPMTFDFGAVLRGTSSATAIEVRNDGGVDLHVTATTLAGTDLNDFSITGGQAPFTLAPGFSRDVSVSFHPAAAGIKNAVLVIDSDDPDESTVTVDLSGTGFEPAPDIDVTPLSLNYGNVETGTSSAPQNILIDNMGTADLTVTSIGIVGNPSEFDITSAHSLPVTIGPGGFEVVEVTYSPLDLGPDNDTLVIASNDPDEASVNVSLTGQAIALPHISVTPSFHDYGSVLEGANSAPQTFVISNNGTAALNVTATNLTGANPNEFRIDSGQSPFAVPPGESRDVVVTFNPTSPGAKSAALSIVSNDPDENTVNVDLQGTSLADADGDGVLDNLDNCPDIANADQADGDGDGQGDACEICDNDPDKFDPGACGCGVADTDLDGDTIPDCNDICPADPDNDADGDGICGDIEDAGPNGGDANEDGIPDSQQANVASLQTSEGTGWVTLESPAGTTLSNSRAVDNPSPADAPADIDFDQGFFGFTLQGLAAGDAITVTITLPAGASPTTYYKYGPTPSDPNPQWYEFMFDGQTGAEINGNVVTLYFVDGQRGDDDRTANGTIIDVGAPGVNVAAAGGGGGGGGCFIKSSSQEPGGWSALMLSLIGFATTVLAAWIRQ